ncbi:hypothetical protein AGOR_G00228940 [Albula goreensis]|uniref:Uncharacterized protein n=1 Tax=Albula goreensis TaxID=1534307 RepID=A0A8T3CHV2_9TELE|nr:hypothetical protein AGOR_G00228940 [Albula goreensis]
MDMMENQSLMRTYTGTRPPVSYGIESQRGEPLPPLLQRPCLITPKRHFSTSVSVEHGRKPLIGPLAHPRHSKASPHWALNFVDELGDRLRDCHAVRTVSQPISDTQDRYRGMSAPLRPEAPPYAVLPALHRQFETDKVPILNVPYISTTRADYRRFSRSEVLPVGVSWSGDDGGDSAPRAAPSQKYQPFLHCPLQHVPHGGLSTLYRDSYSTPTAPSAPPGPAHAPDWSNAEAGRDLLRHILKVPKMYSTENQTYGRNKTILV